MSLARATPLSPQNFRLLLANASSPESPTVLLIGADGSACLTGHKRPEQLKDDLANGRRSYASAAWAWNELPADARTRRLTHLMAPAEPDVAGLEAIAAMIQAGWLGAVVTTDPRRHLLDLLKHHGAGLEEDIHWPSLNEPYAMSRIKAPLGPPVFVDAGELLLRDFKLAVDQTYDGRSDQLGTLQEFLDRFTRVYVWGWCDLNTEMHKLVKENRAHRRRVHLWGKYQAHVEKFDPAGEWVLVSTVPELLDPDDNDDDQATSGLLTQLLPPDPRRGAAKARGPGRPPRLRVPDSGPRPGNGLLVPPGFLGELRECLGQEPRIRFVGIEGETARRRLASWLTTIPAVAQGQHVRGSDVDAVGRQVSVRLASAAATCILVELYDRIGDRDHWTRRLLLHGLRWDQLLAEQVEPAQRGRVVVLAPVEVSKWANNAFEPSKAAAISVYEDHCLSPSVVQAWLESNILPVMPAFDEATAEVMASSIARSAREGGVEWLYEAMDLLVDEIGRDALLAAEGNGQTLPTLWKIVRQHFERAQAIEIPDFDLRLSDDGDGARVIETPPPFDDSFELPPPRRISGGDTSGEEGR